MFQSLHTSLITLLTLSLLNSPLAKASQIIEISQKKSGKIIQVEVISLYPRKTNLQNKKRQSLHHQTEYNHPGFSSKNPNLP